MIQFFELHACFRCETDIIAFSQPRLPMILRPCVIHIQWLVSFSLQMNSGTRCCTVKVSSGFHVVTVVINFPSHYPTGNATPSFEFTADSSIDIAAKSKLIKVSQQFWFACLILNLHALLRSKKTWKPYCSYSNNLFLAIVLIFSLYSVNCFTRVIQPRSSKWWLEVSVFKFAAILEFSSAILDSWALEYHTRLPVLFPCIL